MSTLSNFLLQRLVKTNQKPRIEKSIGFRNTQPLQHLNQLSKMLEPILDGEYSEYESQKLLNLTGAFVCVHSYQRWNERVGPITSLDKLQFTIDSIIKVNPNRLHLINNHWAILDDDILLVYKIEDNILRVLSFYGRVSCNPALSNVKRMRTFCHVHNESINLALSYEELKQQQMPILPQEITKLSGRRTIYVLEKYFVQGVSQPYYVCYKFDKLTRKKNRFIINMANASQGVIGKTLLRLLYMFGELEFLTQYFLYYESEKVEKLQQKQQTYREQKNYLSKWATYPELIAK